MTIKRDQVPAERWSTNMRDKSSRAAPLLFQAQEKRRATSDYQRRREAEQEKTARLRALRRAKEAADRAAADEAMAAKIINNKPSSMHCEAGVRDSQFDKTEEKNLLDRELRHA